jgi:hypothetical protein
MVTDRRAFLAAVGGALASALPGAARGDAIELYAAARCAPDGRFSAAIFSREGVDVSSVALPARGHGLAVCPSTGRCVVFARRPGNFAVAFSARSRAPLVFEAPEDRHFYGHGIFSRDGHLLYATENDFEGGRGIIGVYDATASFRRIGEFPSHGLGPHDLALLQDGVLVVANGGLREHPDIGEGRRVLNLDAIETSLVYIDVTTGDLLERHDIGVGGALSLRHLDVARDGTVVLGAQLVDGAASDPSGAPGLIYRHRRQMPLVATRLSPEAETSLAGYVSSVAVDAAGDVAAVTSSRGSTVLTIDVASGWVLGMSNCDDVSGVAARRRPGGFLVTTGTGGRVVDLPASSGVHELARSSCQWDNHAVRIGS